MNSKEFYTYWNYIESRAFSPDTSDGGIRSWLRCFGKFFNKLFETGERCHQIPKENNTYIYIIKFPKLKINMSCECRIRIGLSKFSFTINWNNSAVQFEYDNRYKCEFDYLDDKKSKKDPSNEFSRDELKEVLKNKIVHPALHCHIKGKISVKENSEEEEIDFPHDIRIGTAGKNPFLFLYQLAYQFLALFGEEAGKKKKERELNRLVEVIYENREKAKISPDTLLGKRK